MTENQEYARNFLNQFVGEVYEDPKELVACSLALITAVHNKILNSETPTRPYVYTHLQALLGEVAEAISVIAEGTKEGGT